MVENRVHALNDRWRLLHQVVAERAADPSLAEVPGGSTGLIVRTVKVVKVIDQRPFEEQEEGPMPRMQLVEEFSVDTGLLAEIRNHERQAAQELGQWTERKDITSAGAALTLLGLQELSDEELDQRLAEAERGKAPQAVPG